MPALFLSYRRSDSPDTVKLIYERLKKRLPRWEIFYDHESIPLGDTFPDLLRMKVTSATVVLVILGPKWLEILHERKNAAVDHVRVEVRLALESAKSVVPILVGRALMPTDADLADFADLQPLLQLHGRPVRPDPDFDSDFEPILDHVKQFDSNEAIGATLADKYTLTAEIGHGGMGVVYRAEQKQPVKRTVAVKLIKPGMDSRDVLARFDAERQALAVMDHPNIAKVHDAGMTAQGRPFFVIEFVKGVPITQYCDEKKLTPQERINLFIPVCNAVQHAHQKGIIHRDLKPSNVLVEVIDGKPVAKVIDFGLAKALGHKLTDLTQPPTVAETRIGTLEYSAPEQAAGRTFDVDTRSDIYSLGVMLYELLTGAPPFTHAELLKIGEEEMKRVIREDEPTTPSKKLSSSGELPSIAANRQLEPAKLTRLVRGDLDWIIMKCLEKENARRYETANQLGQELQRFLADEPVQAGPPSATYRLRKFVRRHKAGLLSTAGVLLATVLGVAIAFWRINLALEGEKKATLLASQRLEIVEQQKEDIQKALESVEEEKKRVKKEQENTAAALEKSRVAEKLALDTVKSVVNEIDAQLRGRPTLQELRKKLLKTAESGLKKVARNAKTAGQIDHEAIWVHIELGDIFLDLDGATAAARKEFELAYSLAAQLADADKGNAEAQRDLSVSLNKVGDVQLRLNQTKEALASYRRSLDIRQKLADADKGNAQAQRDLSVSLNKVGDVQLQLGQTEEALASYRRSLDIRQKLADADKGNAQAQRDLSVSLDNVGDVQRQLGETQEALASYRRDLEISQKLADADKGNAQAQRDLSISLANVGDVQLLLGETQEALASYRRSLDIRQKLADADKGNAQAQRDLSISFNKVGDVQLLLGETQEALASYRRDLEISQKLADADKDNAQAQRDLLVSHYKIGTVAEESRSYQEAADWYKKGLDVAKRFPRPEFFKKEIAILTERLTFCELATKAVADLDFALKQAPGLVPQLLDARIRVWHQKGKHAEVAATAAKLRALADLPKSLPGTNVYNAACGYALASTCADADAKTKEAHAAQSVALLKKARDMGYFKRKGQVEHAKKDTDLDPLRRRGDFQALLAELDKDAK